MLRLGSVTIAAAFVLAFAACFGRADLGGTPERDGGQTSDLPAEDARCCPRDSVVSGCMNLGGARSDGLCGEACDFWCSTDWRVEKDESGCEVWRYSVRSPTPDENTACFPSSECRPTDVAVEPGGTVQPRPSGSVLRLALVYQGSYLGIRKIAGVTMTISSSDGPFQPDTTSGYWAELRDGTGAVLYTDAFQDPTRIEAPGGPGGDGGFMNSTRPLCEAKSISVDLPNDAAGKSIVVFGSPYGTQEVATEIARFNLP